MNFFGFPFTSPIDPRGRPGQYPPHPYPEDWYHYDYEADYNRPAYDPSANIFEQAFPPFTRRPAQRGARMGRDMFDGRDMFADHTVYSDAHPGLPFGMGPMRAGSDPVEPAFSGPDREPRYREVFDPVFGPMWVPDRARERFTPVGDDESTADGDSELGPAPMPPPKRIFVDVDGKELDATNWTQQRYKHEEQRFRLIMQQRKVDETIKKVEEDIKKMEEKEEKAKKVAEKNARREKRWQERCARCMPMAGPDAYLQSGYHHPPRAGPSRHRDPAIDHAYNTGRYL